MVAVTVVVPPIAVPISVARIVATDDERYLRVVATVRDAMPPMVSMETAAAIVAGLGGSGGSEGDYGRKSDAS
jgi:hypothetical protein